MNTFNFGGSIAPKPPRNAVPPPPRSPKIAVAPKRRYTQMESINIDEPTLPPLLRDMRTAHRFKAPALKLTGAFMFKGSNPLYTREVIEERHHMCLIRCSQPGCLHPAKEVDRGLSGSNNYRTHYRNTHPGIPTSENGEQIAIAYKLKEQGQTAGSRFFDKPMDSLTSQEKYRKLLLEFIIKNNLSFSLVDQPETRALIGLLSPNIKQISRKTLMGDLKVQYEEGEVEVHEKLQAHINSGGRIALTTDAWAGNNKLDYICITGHIQHLDGIMESLTLDIIELTNPIHSGKYLAKKMLEVTDLLGITCATISITRDNASPNNVMLDEFEAIVADQWDTMNKEDQVQFCCKFNRKDGDVRCVAHIYNITVQAGL
jgi:hypothetical protein